MREGIRKGNNNGVMKEGGTRSVCPCKSMCASTPIATQYHVTQATHCGIDAYVWHIRDMHVSMSASQSKEIHINIVPTLTPAHSIQAIHSDTDIDSDILDHYTVHVSTCFLV